MSAGNLTSIVANPEGVGIASTTNTYLVYSAKAYDSTTLAGTSTTVVTVDKTASTAGTAVEIISTGSITKKTVNSRAIKVTIPTDEDALAGTYNGTITFAFIAN